MFYSGVIILIMNTYFSKSHIVPGLDTVVVKKHVFPAIYHQICGDLFIEKNCAYQLTLEDGKIINNSSSISGGFSVRKLDNDHMMHLLSSTDISLDNIIANIDKLNKLSPKNIIHSTPNEFKLKKTKKFDTLMKKNDKINDQTIVFIMKIYEYIKSRGYTANILVNISCSNNHREIYNERMEVIEKFRNLWALSIHLTLKKEEKYEVFRKVISSQEGFIFLEENWQELADFVWEGCWDLLHAVEVKAGTKTIICAPGESGVMLHEAVGHALEGDFLATNTSCFSKKQGQVIANSCVTVIDDGTINGTRGTIEYDDEGSEAQHNILIKDGVFVGELSDKIYSTKLQKSSSGNGRRESFAYNVIPRMTNTYLAAGSSSLETMIKKIKDGIFVKDFSGGQVNISTGAFVFNARLAYLIEDGKITNPIKGTMLMGNATQTLHDIVEIGNDLSLCKGSGNCGKNGQTVPVCVGCPSFTLNNITVGGK